MMERMDRHFSVIKFILQMKYKMSGFITHELKEKEFSDIYKDEEKKPASA